MHYCLSLENICVHHKREYIYGVYFDGWALRGASQVPAPVPNPPAVQGRLLALAML